MALFTFASAQDQDNSGSSGTDMQHMGCGDETTHSDPHMERMGAGQDMADSDTELSPEARMLNNRITIDLKEIDKNEDGKVFVDGMCKDVIKDEPGNCPKCGMKLKEVSIDDAKKDLIKNGFKVK
jgi:hypothetical protein